MLQDGLEEAPSLDLPVLAVAVILSLLVLGRALTQRQSLAAKFLFFVIAARYLANFLHAYTAQPVLAGQSLNSYLTLSCALVGAYLCRRHLLKLPAIGAVLAFGTIVVISGLWNGAFAGIVNTSLRLTLFVVVAVLVCYAERNQEGRVPLTTFLLPAFLVPLGLQLFSLLTLQSKPTELDNSTSIIGGYIHEGAFSQIALAAIALILLSTDMTWKRRTLLLVVATMSLLLANYRTAILAAAPMLIAHFTFGGASARLEGRRTVRLLATAAAATFGVIAVVLFAERLSDIWVALGNFGSLIKPPSEFDTAERALFSGRILIWSNYVFAALQADLVNFTLGFGPDSWSGAFAKYAHNVYVSYLYELGVIGLATYLAMIVSFFALCFRIPGDRKWLLLSAHAGYAVLSFGTMPTIVIEGIILHGLIFGYTAYYWQRARSEARVAQDASRRRRSGAAPLHPHGI